jgi:ribonuclease P protein component
MKFPYPASSRLKNSWEFDVVFRAGRQSKGELVRICYVRGQTGTKVGAAVGKKIANAARRSRGRRVLRESLRRLLPWVTDGVWVVTSLRERALTAAADSVYYDMAAVFSRCGLLGETWGGADWCADRRRDF